MGLKVDGTGIHPSLETLPQSNQRGIERGLSPLEAMTGIYCLNRTSVGLKVCPTTMPISFEIPPQSNQRGIESVVELTEERCVIRPQSNQRGIESWWEARVSAYREPASIEPAWD